MNTNKPKTLLLTLAIVLAMLPQFGYAQGTLIWNQTFTDGGGASFIYTNAEFWFGLAAGTNRGDVATQFLFDQVTLDTNSVGHTFTIVSTADDPDFTVVVNSLTNGINQSFQYTMGLHGNSGTTGFPESQLFEGVGTGPDLIGYQIQSFGLRIDSLTFDTPGSNPNNNGIWTDYSEQVTLSIYGSAVPEPSSSLLILLGSGVFIYARRKYNLH